MISRHVCFCVSVNACDTQTQLVATFFLNGCSIKIWWNIIRGITVSVSISYHYIPIFVKYCDYNNNACVVNYCRGLIRPRIVLWAHCHFPKTFMPLLNCAFVQCSISTNLLQQSMNEWELYCHTKLRSSCIHVIWIA